MKQFLLIALLVVGATAGFAQEARSVEQAIHYIKLANTLRAVRKSDESISLLNRALPAVKSKNLYWEAVTNELLGLCYNDLNDPKPAVKYLEVARSQFAQLKYVASAWGVNEVIRDISGKNLYAGIQIGVSEVKLAIFKTEYESDFYDKDIRSVVSVPNVSLTADASTAFRQEQNALKTCLDSIQHYGIPNERVFIVFNSELAKSDLMTRINRAQLYQQLAGTFPKGSNFRIDTTLTPAREAELFTVGAIPRKVWDQTSALNIDNEHITVSYFDRGPGMIRKTFHYNSAPVGINTIMTRIDPFKFGSPDAFAREAQRLVKAMPDTLLVPSYRLRGLPQRQTVGVGGAIAAALVTYLYPEKALLAAVPISLADVEQFRQRAITNYETLIQPQFSPITDRKARTKAYQNMQLAQNQLTQKQLIAGALLLEATFRAYPDASRKRFVFIRDADISWVTGKFLETINYEYTSTIAKGALYTR